MKTIKDLKIGDEVIVEPNWDKVSTYCVKSIGRKYVHLALFVSHPTHYVIPIDRHVDGSPNNFVFAYSGNDKGARTGRYFLSQECYDETQERIITCGRIRKFDWWSPLITGKEVAFIATIMNRVEKQIENDKETKNE
jgi:hypothetical protein